MPTGQEFGGTPIPDGSEDLLLTPVGAGTSINGNANAAGISGGGNGIFIGTNEGIRLDFVNDLTGNPAGGDFPANADFVFADHYEVNGAAVTFGGINLGRQRRVSQQKTIPMGTMLWAMELWIPSPP